MTKIKYRTAGWRCTGYNCSGGEDDSFDNIENTRNRAKYHARKTGHKVNFWITNVTEYIPTTQGQG